MNITKILELEVVLQFRLEPIRLVNKWAGPDLCFPPSLFNEAAIIHLYKWFYERLTCECSMPNFNVNTPAFQSLQHAASIETNFFFNINCMLLSYKNAAMQIAESLGDIWGGVLAI